MEEIKNELAKKTSKIKNVTIDAEEYIELLTCQILCQKEEAKQKHIKEMDKKMINLLPYVLSGIFSLILIGIILSALGGVL